MLKPDYVFSTKSIQDLIKAIDHAPESVKHIAQDLVYRDFLTVGILTDKIKSADNGRKVKENGSSPD